MKTHSQSFRYAAVFGALLLLSGCAETQLATHWAKQISWPGQDESKGTYKIGNPYKVGSVWYYPEENFSLVETGIASWYGPGFHADHTANGEVFDQNQLTAAHRTLQLPSLVRVTNLENGNSVVVRVNDRGPFLHGRIMDVSRRAAELLGFANKGTARIRLEVLGNESRILAAAAKRGEDTSRMTLADIDQQMGNGGQQPATEQPVRMAAADNAPAAADDAMPESLRTPTITVEELSAPGTHAAAAPPAAYTPPQPVAAAPIYQAPPAAYQPPPSGLTPGHLTTRGKFVPDPVVSKEAVHPTGIFVQAGSFGVRENAERLAKKLSSIGPTSIESVSVSGRQFYRVKLGPISSVDKADGVLEKVIRASGSGAKVIKN